MFCKKCGNRISETDTFCPVCGAAADRKGGLSIHHTAADPGPAAPQPQPLAPAPQAPADPPAKDDLSATMQLPALDPDGADPESIVPAGAPAPQPVRSEPTVTEAPAPAATPDTLPAQPLWDAQDVDDAPPEPPVPPAAPTPAAGDPDGAKKETRSRRLLKCFVCLLAAGMIALTVISRTTDLFTKEQNTVKEVPYSGFTAAEKESFLTFFSPLSALCGSTLEICELDQTDFLALLRPWDPAGLYAGSFPVETRRTEPQDPRGRYPDGYYAVPETQVKQVADLLGAPYAGGVNTGACYAYRGTLYFDAAGTAAGKKRSVTDASATRIEGGNFDGWYYITCTCDDGSKSYCLAANDPKNTARPWALGTVSSEELFDNGTKRETETDALPFEMRQETLTAQTAAGQVYAQYVVIYPWFSDSENAAAQQINALYESYVAAYRAKAEQGEKRYARYVELGYDLTLLPAYEYKICSVTYNQNGWISLLDETVTYRPETYAKEQLAALADGESWDALTPATEVTSGYTVNVTTGEVLHTQDVLGAEDEAAWTLLCDAYPKQTNEDGEEEPVDLETLGRQLYAAPWVLTADGVTLFYRDAQADYPTQVTLPYEKLPTDTFKKF
ncbi:MAG: zinc-ribbon domain-containing protein [Clostridia bacterium]|nr:zinc-ribbon domain-containing protein [Clostridia bacterium]